MSTHEWDVREALGAEGRATDLIHTLEHEINRLRDKVNRLELELLVCNDLLDSVAAERDVAIDRCVAVVAAHGTPGPVSLGGMAREWPLGPSGLDENDIIGFA